LGDKLSALQAAAKRKIGEPIPMRLQANEKLFNVPDGLIRILDRDLVAAGIARWVKDLKTGKAFIDKRDERGRTIDVHALRTTFGTHLSKGGVPLRTAQAAMRHSKPDLTANVYTDPKLLDVAGALDALPALPLDPNPLRNEAKATGTDGAVHADAIALLIASNSGQTRAGGGTSGNRRKSNAKAAKDEYSAASDVSVNRNGSRSTGDHEPARERAMGLEPTTASLEGWHSAN
jgi:hypothetical protein